jgi:hypothetical protein
MAQEWPNGRLCAGLAPGVTYGKRRMFAHAQRCGALALPGEPYCAAHRTMLRPQLDAEAAEIWARQELQRQIDRNEGE